MDTVIGAWKREARRLAGACKTYETELAKLRARLVAVEAERDRLKKFTEWVHRPPGVCACEYMSETSRRIGLRCLHCMAAAALATPAAPEGGRDE